MTEPVLTAKELAKHLLAYVDALYNGDVVKFQKDNGYDACMPSYAQVTERHARAIAALDEPHCDKCGKLMHVDTGCEPWCFHCGNSKSRDETPAPALPQPREVWRLLDEEPHKLGDEAFASESRAWFPCSDSTWKVRRRRELVYLAGDVEALVERLEYAQGQAEESIDLCKFQRERAEKAEAELAAALAGKEGK